MRRAILSGYIFLLITALTPPAKAAGTVMVSGLTTEIITALPVNSDTTRAITRIIAGDGLQLPWINSSWSAMVDFTNTEKVFGGSTSVKAELNGWGALRVHSGEWGYGAIGQELIPYDTLSFRVWQSAPAGKLLVGLSNMKPDHSFTPVLLDSLDTGKWVKVEIPLSDLGPPDEYVNQIRIVNYTGSSQTLWVDDWKLSGDGGPATRTIAGEGLEAPWMNSSWGGNADYDNTEKAFSGTISAKADLGGWGALRVHAGEWGYAEHPELTPYDSLQFQLWPQNAGPIFVKFSSVAEGNFQGVLLDSLEAGQWNRVSLPLEQLSPDGDRPDQIYIMNYTSDARTFWVDDWALSREGGDIPVDTVPPVITLASPADSTLTNQQQITVAGSVSEPLSLLVVNEDTVAAYPDSSFAVPVSITEGLNNIAIEAVDLAGNSSVEAVAVTGDFTAPNLYIDVALGDPSDPATEIVRMNHDDTLSTDRELIYLLGEAHDALSEVSFAVNQMIVPAEQADSLYLFETQEVLDEGANSYTVLASDGAGNSTETRFLLSRIPSEIPAIVLDNPPKNYETDSALVSLAGAVIDTTANVSFTINNQPVVLSPDGSFSHNVSLAPGNNYFLLEAVNADSSTTFTARNIFRTTPLPPDPTEVAPPVDSTVVTTMYHATDFLYKGDNPVQHGVEEGIIDPTRAGVVRGKVLDRTGSPLPGAVIKVLDHPEYGYTLSRADGAFDMVVNGGGKLTVTYEKNNYLPVQRQINVPWQGYGLVDSVVMIPLDPNVTTIDFSDTLQVARGSVMTDADGPRQSTLLFEQGTSATMVLPDGRTLALASLDVRATEYTVGENGPASMPAKLPPTSGYTYAVEFSVDEALEAGATEVTFDKPVINYVENFVGFPVGTPVPAGYYDRARGEWIASENGRVIEIIATGNGLADIDISGDGIADPADSLLALGIDQSEREQLATLYSAGESLWRTEITHFTPWDCNWPFGPPADAEPPSVEQPPEQELAENDKSNCEEGSIISLENRTLGEMLDITGGPCGLYYNSANTHGFTAGYKLPVVLTENTMSTSLKRIKLKIHVAGISFDTTLAAQSNLTYDFQWNRKDVYNRVIQGNIRANIEIGYVYDGIYNQPANTSRSFGQPGQEPVITGDRETSEITLWQKRKMSVGNLTRTDFGGWHPGIHHQYDMVSQNIYEGNGRIRSAESVDSIVRKVLSGNENNAQQINDVAVGPGGSVYTSLRSNDNFHQIKRKSPTGEVEIIIESELCFTPSIATITVPEKFECLRIGQIDVSAKGEIYFVDQFNNRAFKITKDGELKHIAGNGEYGYSGDEGPATAAQFRSPVDIAVGDDGSVYIADSFNNVIRKISTNGIITTFAGTGEYLQEGDIGDGGPALQAKFAWARGLDVGPDGTLYIADADQGRIRKVTPDGIISTVAGSENYTGRDYGDEFQNDRGDGGPAASAILLQPYDVAVGKDGSLYIAENNAHHIRKVTPAGTIFRFAGLYGEIPYRGASNNDEGGFNYNNGPAQSTRLSFPNSITTGPDGNIYFTEEGNTANVFPKVRMIEAEFDYFDGSQLVLTSSDGGQLYDFNALGKHQTTRDALTGNTIYSFEYDSTGLLSKIIDIDGLETTIERAPDGTPTAFVAPFGQRTELTMGPDGYLSSVENPGGETVQFSYTEGGLLTGMIDPKNNLTTYQYDSLGYFRRADYPNGGFKELSKVETEDGFEVTMTTAEGMSTSYRVGESVDGTKEYTHTDAYGLSSVRRYGSDGTVSRTSPNGTTTYTKQKPDPRFGMQAPLTDTLRITTPSGLQSVFSQNRTITQVTGHEVTGLTDSLITNGRITVSEYDGNQHTRTTTSPEGRTSVSHTDSLGRVIQSVTPGIEPVSYSYNSNGFLTQIEQGGRTTAFTYNTEGYLESTTDPLGRTETTEYDSVGRVTRQILPNGEEIGYAYDDNGNLASITPPGQPAHSFEYTEVDLTDNYTPPVPTAVGDSAGGIHYLYDKDEKLLSTVFSDSSSINIVYDTTFSGTNRPIAINYDQGSTSFAYDSTTGQLSSVASADSVVTSYSYDGSLTTQIATQGPAGGVIDFTYNNDFQVTSQSINGANTIGFSYDDDGLLVGAGALSMSYNAQNGLLKSDTLGPVISSYSYNGFGELTQKTAAYNGSDLYNRSFSRDSLGRITGITKTIDGETDNYEYSYNDIGYLIRVKKNGVVTDQYTYDANGNRIKHITPFDTVTATYDAQDRMLTYGDASYSYGPRGDLQRKIVGTDTTSYNYDNQGNLRSVTLPDGSLIEYVIDGQDRRVAKKVNGQITKKWLYADGLMPIAELDSTGSVKKRYGPGYIVKNDTTYRVIKDHLGSVRMVVNSQTGEVVQQIDYDAWGNITNLQNPDDFTDIGFAGGLYDKHTGLVRFGARDYNPRTGRWTSKDPILFAGGTSNLYEYALNDPVNRVDRTGLQATQYSLGFGVSGGMFLVGHLGTGIGVSVDWNDLGNSRLFVNGQYSLMMGTGVAAYGAVGPSRGVTSEQLEGGYTKNNIIHAEAALGAGEVGSASLDLNLALEKQCGPESILGVTGGDYDLSGRGGLGVAGFVGVGVGQSHSYTTPNIRELLIRALF